MCILFCVKLSFFSRVFSVYPFPLTVAVKNLIVNLNSYCPYEKCQIF